MHTRILKSFAHPFQLTDGFHSSGTSIFWSSVHACNCILACASSRWTTIPLAQLTDVRMADIALHYTHRCDCCSAIPLHNSAWEGLETGHECLAHSGYYEMHWALCSWIEFVQYFASVLFHDAIWSDILILKMYPAPNPSHTVSCIGWFARTFPHDISWCGRCHLFISINPVPLVSWFVTCAKGELPQRDEGRLTGW